jgi:hypothetical protein
MQCVERRAAKPPLTQPSFSQLETNKVGEKHEVTCGHHFATGRSFSRTLTLPATGDGDILW